MPLQQCSESFTHCCEGGGGVVSYCTRTLLHLVFKQSYTNHLLVSLVQRTLLVHVSAVTGRNALQPLPARMSPRANRFIVASFAFHAAARRRATADCTIMAVTSRALTSKINDLTAVLNALWLLPSVTGCPILLSLLNLYCSLVYFRVGYDVEDPQEKPWK